MIDLLNRTAALLVDSLTQSMQSLPPWAVLLAHALLIALAALAAYALIADRAALLRSRNRMIARVLEIRLLQDDPLGVLTSFGRVIGGTMVYLQASLKPLLLLLPVVLLWVAQLAGWFEWRPLAPGEAAVVTVVLKPGTNPRGRPAALTVPAGFAVETPAFRSPAGNELAWRIRALQPSRGVLRLGIGDLVEEKDLSAGRSFSRVSPARTGGGLWQRILRPGESPLRTEGVIAEIRIDYPRRPLRILGRDVNWIVVLVASSILFALALKKPFRVEF